MIDPTVATPCAPAGASSAGEGPADAELSELARAFGTPLYVFDDRELTARVARLRAALPAGTGLCYAMKANTFILPELAGAVDRIEVCSPGEYRICREVGVPCGKLVVSGVHKDDATVAAAVADRAGILTVESRAQMELICRHAREQGVRVPVLLRLSSGNQFGLDGGALTGLVREHLGSGCVELRGVQFFSGTQKAAVRQVSRELERIDRFLAELELTTGWAPREFEYGPGLPVAYFEADAFDEDAYLAALARGLEGMAFSGEVSLEVGRSIAASCGTYLTRAVDAKVNRGRNYAIVDGGIHQLVYYGRSMAMQLPPCRVLGRGRAAPGDRPVEPWNICGSLCTVNDVLAKQLPLPGLDVGDVLAFSRAGAYCATEGISLFLSRDLPGVVVIDRAGVPRCVRGALRTDGLNTPAPSAPAGPAPAAPAR